MTLPPFDIVWFTAGVFTVAAVSLIRWLTRTVQVGNKRIALSTFAASELAIKLRAKPVPLVTEYTTDANERKVAWRVAGPHINNETRLIAAGLQFLIAEGYYELTNDEDKNFKMARKVALWWHEVEEADVEE